MTKGRKAAPAHLKALRGTLRARDNQSPPQAATGTPVAPDWLSDRASEIFNSLCAKLLGMGVLSPDHVDALSLLASRIEEVEILTIVARGVTASSNLKILAKHLLLSNCGVWCTGRGGSCGKRCPV